MHDAIVDLNFAFKPDLVVVDGIVAMEGIKGPTNGTPIRTDMIIALGQRVLISRKFPNFSMLWTRRVNPYKREIDYFIEQNQEGEGIFCERLKRLISGRYLRHGKKSY